MGKSLQYFFMSLGNMLDFTGGGNPRARLLLARRLEDIAARPPMGNLARDFACIGKDISTACTQYGKSKKTA